MIQVRRYIPYCQIGLWLVVIALTVDIALRTMDGTPVLAWVPRAVTGTGYLEDSRLRVAQTLQEYREKRIAPHEYLAVIVGISNVREGVELSAITQMIGPQWRLLGLAGAGFGMGSFQQYTNLVFESELRPDIAVLGLGLHQLVDIRPNPGAADPTIMEKLRRGNFREAAVALRNSMWTYSRREDINVSVEFAVLELRANLLAAFGVPLPLAEAHKRSPWREMIKTDWPEHFSAATLEAQERGYESIGIFDRERYENSPTAMSTLMGIIKQFRRRGTKVVLLLMPENSRLYRRIPSEALEILKRQLHSAFPGDEPPILDFRITLEDSGFVDLPHLNQKGRLEFSRQLGSKLRDLLPNGGTPLMALNREPQSGSQLRSTER